MEKGHEKTDYNFFTYLVTCSEYYRGIMKRCFNCSDNQIMIAGQPRCDRLFFDLPETDEKIRKGAKKLFVWFPTYRLTEDWPFPLLTRDDMHQLDEKLGAAGNRMIIKLHPLQAYEPDENNEEEQINKFKNIEIYQESDMKDLGVNIYDMSRAADALITDYSSIYFDYLLLNRPMAFTVDDIGKYGRERGFLLDSPKDYMPGELINNAEEFNKFIDDVSADLDEYAGDRARVNDLINTYKDGNNCQRMLNKVGICK
jgi:CDP-glycerol glycerophosphotransferase (TagB/SpsB family)